MERLFDVQNVVETGWDPATGIVLVRWITFTGHDHLRPCLQAQMQVVGQGARVLIVDAADAAGVPSDEDQDWFGQVVFPFYRQHGLSALINVQPRSALTRLGTRRWSRTASGFGFDIIDCSSLDHAYELAHDYLSEAA